MAASNFQASLKRVLVYEGGFSDHPKDPGGATMKGVIQRVYDAYRQRKGLPMRSVKSITNAELQEIYRRQYWDAVRGDELPAGIDFVVFDGAVNSGPAQSVKWLQRALGVAADGAIGEATLAAVKAAPDHDVVVADICARRLAFLRQLKTFPTFGKGWTDRVANVKATGQALATGSVGPSPVPVHEDLGHAKASPSDIAEAPVPVGAAVPVAAGSGAATGAVDQLQQAAGALSPLSDTLQVVKWVCVGITVVVTALALYGIYRSYKAQRARNGEDSLEVAA